METTFTCNCKNGKTVVIDENTVKHTCGFRPSQSYGMENAEKIYEKHGNNWFVKWLSTPKVKPEVAS